jgi:hypothetical protein
MRPTLLACALLFASQAFAELPPDKVAELRHKQKKAEDEVAKKHGGKKPADMTRAEFQAMQTDKLAARSAVLEKEGVDAKEFDRSSMKQNRADRAATEAKIKELEKKDADESAAKEKAKAEAEKAAQAGATIPIQRGFNEQNPVELENLSGAPTVEKGVPEDVQKDIDEARLQGNEAGGGPTAPADPKAAAKKAKK